MNETTTRATTTSILSIWYGNECGEYAINTFCEYYGSRYIKDIDGYDFYFTMNVTT